ncbi:integrase, catalytic region, zinc finger, CCHC-type containing protein [Tanacetum coccineum]|uniref:Integrase, catalytic region, zinc finger, CCHC-type containing protein n=1 Tax=Tanacetum coccineum TaxID=301880 RepID=A0ABQ5GH54_9ASTR
MPAGFKGSSTNACNRTICTMAMHRFLTITLIQNQMVMALRKVLFFHREQSSLESEKEHTIGYLLKLEMNLLTTVDACQTAQEMWEAIERLQQGESLNIQDVKTNLFWEFGQFTSHDGETIESYYTRFYKMMNEMIRNNLTVATMQVNVQFLQQLQPEWSRFVTIVKQQHKLDEVPYHKLFDILKQYQKEVNELRAERMAKNANPLALVATAQTMQDPYYQTPKHHKAYAPTSKVSLPTRSHTATRYKGKEIAKPITPPSEKGALTGPVFGNQRVVNAVGARETVGGPVVQQSGIQCFNCKEFGHYAKECRKPKRVRDSTYHKEKMLLYEKLMNKIGSTLQLHDKDSRGSKCRHSALDSECHSEPVESGNGVIVNVIPVLNRICVIMNIRNDQYDVECDNERAALANLIR